MKVFFDHVITGAPRSFLWEDGSISLGESPGQEWRFSHTGKRYRCIKSASEAAGCDLIETPNAPQTAFWRKHTQHPAWHRIIPKDGFRIHLDRQIRKVIDFMSDESNQYYLDTFQIQQRLLDRLRPAKVQDESLADSGFVPDQFGFVEIPCYDNAHSSTGRMTVVSGPKILTLQKDLRKKIVSRWDDGVLVEVDFNALDARVLGWISGHKEAEGDMYEWIGQKSGTKEAPRNVVKEATLSAMYGMSRRNFALRFQDFPDAVEVYEKVRMMMKVRELESRLSEEKNLKNAFGRKLTDTSARVSHHVQSSAVDVACCGFDWLVSQVEEKVCLPVFLIHDAIVLDVKQKYLENLEEICKSGLKVSIIDQTLPVKIRRF